MKRIHALVGVAVLSALALLVSVDSAGAENQIWDEKAGIKLKQL